MKRLFSTKRLCRAGVIAALYVALTYAFMPLAYQGVLQIRPAEALCILPLFFPEAIPALFLGCVLSNIASPLLAYDLPIGSAVTLVASIGTFFVGWLLRKKEGKGAHALRVTLGGLPPVLLNAFILPLVLVVLSASTSQPVQIAYWLNFGSLLATQAVWIFGLGTPLYLFVFRMQKRGFTPFLDETKK